MWIHVLDIVVALFYLIVVVSFACLMKSDYKTKAVGKWKVLYDSNFFFIYMFAKTIIGLNNTWRRLFSFNLPFWVVNFVLMAHFNLNISFWMGAVLLGSCMFTVGFFQILAYKSQKKFYA